MSMQRESTLIIGRSESPVEWWAVRDKTEKGLTYSIIALIAKFDPASKSSMSQ